MWSLDSLFTDAAKVLNNGNPNKKLKKIENLRHKAEHELVDYVYSIVKDLPIFEVESTPYRGKSNEKCDQFRRQANELFVRDFNWEEGLKMFSKSVSYAVPGSENLSQAYSNRSHVLADQQFYEHCLQDVNRALECNSPENLKQILVLRKERIKGFKCYQKRLVYHDSIPELKHKSKLIESATNAIAIGTNEKWGDHIVAIRNIKIGEVVAVEAPYIGQVEPVSRYLHCHECMELCYNMIACETCTEVMYCNENCREKAYKTYHKYECVLLQHGLERKRLFVRLTLKSLLEYDRFVDDLSNKDDRIYHSNRYKEVHQIEHYKNEKTPMELFEASLEPVVFYHYLTKYTDILQDLEIEDKERVFKGLLLRNYLITLCNIVSIEKMERKFDNLEFQSSFLQVGHGVFPFYSKFHHSCFSNTMPIFYGSSIVVRALTNIKKGEHVTTTFGSSFINSTKKERELELQKYNYVCRCEPCVRNWPTMEQLRTGTPVPKKLERKVMDFFNDRLFENTTVYNILAEAFTFYNTLKVTEIPTENYVLLRCLISDLMVCLGNVTVY